MSATLTAGARHSRKQALLFEKRRRNSCHLAGALSQQRDQISKSFWFFFQKELLLRPAI
jgi:hypothetical protein